MRNTPSSAKRQGVKTGKRKLRRAGLTSASLEESVLLDVGRKDRVLDLNGRDLKERHEMTIVVSHAPLV